MVQHDANDTDDGAGADADAGADDADDIEPTARSDVVRRRYDEDGAAFAVPKTVAEAILDETHHDMLPAGRCEPASDDLLGALIDAFADTPRDPGRATMRREAADTLRAIRDEDAPLYVERIGGRRDDADAGDSTGGNRRSSAGDH